MHMWVRSRSHRNVCCEKTFMSSRSLCEQVRQPKLVMKKTSEYHQLASKWHIKAYLKLLAKKPVRALNYLYSLSYFALANKWAPRFDGLIASTLCLPVSTL